MEVLRVVAHLQEKEAKSIVKGVSKPIGIKPLLMAADRAIQGQPKGHLDVEVFMKFLNRGWKNVERNSP